MNRLSQLAESFQENVEAYIRALDETHTKMREDAGAFLKSLQTQGQQRQKELPLAPRRFYGGGGPAKAAGETNTQIVENALRSVNKQTFTVNDVKEVLKLSGTSMTDDQMGTAFRKLKARKRPPSPMELVRGGRGHIPPVYRLRHGYFGDGQ